MKPLLLTLIIFLGPLGNLKAQINDLAIDSLLEKAVRQDAFEGTVLIALNGNVAYHKSFGFTDQGEIEPIRNTTRFSIASITKLFTAIITLQLVEEGRIALDDSLTELLPEINIPQSEKITVHHLLLHISGLPNENDNLYNEKVPPRAFVSQTILREHKVLGEFNYANVDYVLLGLIIEKFDQVSFEQAVRNRILDICSMRQTGFLHKGDYPENFAYSFSYRDDKQRQADPLRFIENYYAAGSMYATAMDLLKLDQALYGTDLLTQESKALMFTSYPEYNYSGYSVWTYNYPFAPSNPKIMERRGGILGANAVLIRFLEANKTIIILSNNNQFNPDSFGHTESLKEGLMIEVDKAGS